MARVDLLPRLTQAVDVIQLSCFQEQLREQAIPLRPPPSGSHGNVSSRDSRRISGITPPPAGNSGTHSTRVAYLKPAATTLKYALYRERGSVNY